MVRVAVLGAGVVGLTSAVSLQKALPQAEVTLVADKFGAQTTSDGAGGFFWPYMPDISKGVDPHVAEQWVRDSWTFYNSLARSTQAEESGNALVSGVAVYYEDKESGYDLLRQLVPDFRKMSSHQLQEMGLGRYKFGYAFTTVVSQSFKIIAWLLQTFKDNGGKVQERTVKDLKEFEDFDVVVNCCGLRANETTGDAQCFPIKGQLVHVHAPWQKQFFFADDNIYLIPHDDKLIIGGVRMKGNSSTAIDPDIRATILARAHQLFPQLKSARIVGEWVGLRPGREAGVRLEVEKLACGPGRTLTVVHNYGHGGHGVTLSWGCALHATRLVTQQLGSKARL